MSQIVRFTQLELKNWRNFTAVNVKLSRRMFIVGPNAIGKSNLLDVFRFLREVAAEGGGLATAVKNRRGVSKLRSLHYRAPASSDIEIGVEVIASDDSAWRYKLAFNKSEKKFGAGAVVTHEHVWKKAATDEKWSQIVDRPSAADKADPKLLTQTWLQQVTQNQPFRELAEFLASVSYLHLVPQLIREEQRPAEESLGADAFGRDLLSRIRSTPIKTKEARLERIRRVLATAVPNLTELELVPDENNNPHLQAKFKHWRGPAAKQDEREFSDGTLRLIGLLWALQERSGPLLLEEPELSLHTALVRQLAPFIARAQRTAGGRQAFISTHSDELMSDEGIGPNEILLVRSAAEGSQVVHGADIAEIRIALEAGLTAADIVMPMTAKDQIDLFSRTDA
ncbi:MAG: AAA family ATPase [Ramlibacter sp.]|nr:AAA family ATPase [Ramlibacter sp.]